VRYHEEDSSSSFALETHFALQGHSSSLWSVRIFADEIDAEVNLRSFRDAVKRFAEVLVLQRLTFDFKMNDDAEDAYVERMKKVGEHCGSVAGQLEEYAKGKFDVERLANDIRHVGALVADWFNTADPADGPFEGRFEQWFAQQPEYRFIDDFQNRYVPLGFPAPSSPVQFEALDDKDYLLAVWDLVADNEVVDVIDNELPFAQPGSRFWHLMKERITGGADQLLLLAIDGRASPTDGVTMQRILWPGWIEELLQASNA